MYLFEQADVDVIVFEDIDRFEINQIFERLREINALVNNRLNNQEKTLKFLYLLKDDIFFQKKELSFFDFIIPVIPVIDSSNSYDKILEMFSGENIEESFLEEVSLFIDDMRLLRNISNEFKIYKGRLGNINLNLNNLLGTVIYKNLFPRDFSDLQLNQGFVYYLFSNKEKFIENERKKLEEKIVEYDKEIEKIKKVYIENNIQDEELKNKNYTHICKNRNNELFRYIDESIDNYFRVIIDNYGDIEDDSEIAIGILNKEELSEELKEEYIEKLKTKITDISKIENKKYLDRLLEKENVTYTSGNILTYFDEREETLNDILINFINLDEEELEFSNYSNEELEKFFDRFIVCNELDNEVYKKIIGELGWQFEGGNFPTTISKDKMDILIEKDIIIISKKNLLSMRKSYKENLEFYIQKNIEEYIEILNTEPDLFSQEELLLILENNNLSEKNKLEVLEMSKETISIKNKNYSENIKNYILDNNYDGEDFEYLVLNYENFSDTIKDKIFKFILESKKEFNLIIEEVSGKLLDLCLESSEIEKDEKLTVLLNVLDKSNEAREFKNKLKLLNLEEYKNIFRRSRTLEFEKTEFNKKLLEKLLEKDYIEKLEEREKIEEENSRKVYEVLTKENPLKVGGFKEK